MKNLDFKKIISSIKNLLDEDPLKIEPNPKRDWTILFMIFCCAVIVSGIVHYYFYQRFLFISQKDQTIDSQPTKTIQLEDVQKVIDQYKNKETEFNKLMNEKPTYADPSR